MMQPTMNMRACMHAWPANEGGLLQNAQVLTVVAPKSICTRSSTVGDVDIYTQAYVGTSK